MKEEVKTTLNPAEVKAKPASKTRFVVFVGLCIAIMAVSAWVVIPFGPIPFTLQIFAVAFAILVLPPKQCMAAVGGYLLAVRCFRECAAALVCWQVRQEVICGGI